MTKHTAAEFAAARFAEHPDGRIAARITPGGANPWCVQVDPPMWAWQTDSAMAVQGWRIVTPAPDLSDPDVIEQAAQRAHEARYAADWPDGRASWDTLNPGSRDAWRAVVRAVLTLPPARDPEAEKLEADLRDRGVGYGTGMRVDAIADYLVAQGWTKRVVGGEG